jgi:putative transposase
MTFAFIAKHRHIWRVSWMCAVLEVSRSGFHAWLKRPLSRRAAHDATLVTAIDRSFKASDRTYGARRVWRDVLEDGLTCGLHRIERLMRQNAMRARPKRRGKPKDDGERSVIADIEPVNATGSREPARLDRDFEADRPNQKWLADFTYIWTAEGWLCVSVVLDLFSRRVVGWSMKVDRDASLVMDALMMAVWQRGKSDALLHHSDQGSQYTSEQFQRLLVDNGISCSMSRAGNVWDRTMGTPPVRVTMARSAMESFFSSLKTERTARKVYRSRDAARADVFDYIERFYFPRRRHSKLGYMSPMAFEDQAMHT